MKPQITKADLDLYLGHIENAKRDFSFYGRENLVKLEEMAWDAIKRFYMQNSFDNLFSADHRNMMISKYGYSDAMGVTVGELIHDQFDGHDCNMHLKGYCRACEVMADMLA